MDELWIVLTNMSRNEIQSWIFPENLGNSRRGYLTDCGGAAAAADADEDPDDEDET